MLSRVDVIYDMLLTSQPSLPTGQKIIRHPPLAFSFTNKANPPETAGDRMPWLLIATWGWPQEWQERLLGPGRLWSTPLLNYSDRPGQQLWRQVILSRRVSCCERIVSSCSLSWLFFLEKLTLCIFLWGQFQSLWSGLCGAPWMWVRCLSHRPWVQAQVAMLWLS